jgi:hypothetical protein
MRNTRRWGATAGLSFWPIRSYDIPSPLRVMAGNRVYFGWDGDVLVILLGGGTKKSQPTDIRLAQTHWAEYKAKKRG